jgi:hypothetical protein
VSLSFSMEKQLAKIAHINLREEMHGEDAVIAIDVTVTFATQNDFLAYLSPTLKGSLYGKDEAQGELIKDDTHLPKLRYPEFGTLHWDGIMGGAGVVLHGAKKADDITLEADVNKLRIECMEGGTVIVTLRVQTLPTEGACGAIAALLGKDIKVSIRPKEEAGE